LKNPRALKAIEEFIVEGGLGLLPGSKSAESHPERNCREESFHGADYSGGNGIP
jgi:hypothetical protein